MGSAHSHDDTIDALKAELHMYEEEEDVVAAVHLCPQIAQYYYDRWRTALVASLPGGSIRVVSQPSESAADAPSAAWLAIYAQVMDPALDSTPTWLHNLPRAGDNDMKSHRKLAQLSVRYWKKTMELLRELHGSDACCPVQELHQALIHLLELAGWLDDQVAVNLYNTRYESLIRRQKVQFDPAWLVAYYQTVGHVHLIRYLLSTQHVADVTQAAHSYQKALDHTAAAASPSATAETKVYLAGTAYYQLDYSLTMTHLVETLADDSLGSPYVHQLHRYWGSRALMQAGNYPLALEWLDEEQREIIRHALPGGAHCLSLQATLCVELRLLDKARLVYSPTATQGILSPDTATERQTAMTSLLDEDDQLQAALNISGHLSSHQTQALIDQCVALLLRYQAEGMHLVVVSRCEQWLTSEPLMAQTQLRPWTQLATPCAQALWRLKAPPSRVIGLAQMFGFLLERLGTQLSPLEVTSYRSQLLDTFAHKFGQQPYETHLSRTMLERTLTLPHQPLVSTVPTGPVEVVVEVKHPDALHHVSNDPSRQSLALTIDPRRPTAIQELRTQIGHWCAERYGQSVQIGELIGHQLVVASPDGLCYALEANKGPESLQLQTTVVEWQWLPWHQAYAQCMAQQHHPVSPRIHELLNSSGHLESPTALTLDTVLFGEPQALPWVHTLLHCLPYRITELRLARNNLTDTDLAALVDGFGVQQLKLLDLSVNQLTHHTIQRLAKTLQHSQKDVSLVALNLSHNPLGNQVWPWLITLAQHTPFLASVTLTACHLTMVVATPLPDLPLPHNEPQSRPSLGIEFSGNGLSDQASNGSDRIVPMASLFPTQLIWQSFSDAHFTSQALEGFGNLTRLQHLLLASCPVTQDHSSKFQALCRALHTCNQLECLGLQHWGLTARDIPWLQQLVYTLPKCHSLDIAHNSQLGPRGALALATAFDQAQFSRLSRLTLDNCGLEAQDLVYKLRLLS
ncbi:hypothetical protein H4R35_000707 [Dimargaris xerosporica]|nr:hypothetical protein H4R35_000707 [Dimargaris xerosporica]